MKITINLAKITPRERGYLIGFYIGDGNIFEQKSHGIYRLRYFLALSEKSIQEKIVKILSKVHNNVRAYKGQRNTMIVEAHSKQLTDWIKNACTKDGIKKQFPVQFKMGVIEGLIDSDGYVQRKYVEITTINEKLKTNMIELLKEFQIKTNIRNFISPLSKRKGWRIGFSLKNCVFKPLKWVFAPQTAENAA